MTNTRGSHKKFTLVVGVGRVFVNYNINPSQVFVLRLTAYYKPKVCQ